MPITFYRCEKCNREFNNLADTKNCEKNHLKITEAHITHHGIHPHPYAIEVTFNNGDIRTYVIER